ncbi:MAG TPA: VWA domain-containing protein [Candidatus Acidoferrum sp.]|jgi:VWFA-related protein
MTRLARTAWLFSACLLAVTLSQRVATAQQSESPAAAQTSAIRLNVVAAHKNGPPVDGLEQKDFTVIDNKHTQPITSFRAISGRDSKAKVIVVLDAVNIDFQRVAFAREEIDKYLRAEGGQLTHPTAFALLTDDGMKLQEQYAIDGNAVSAAVDANITGLRSIRRSSQYGGFDRFNISIEGLRELVQREVSTPERKIVLFVSPGWPILSGPSIENALDSKQQKQLFDTLVNLITQMQRANMTLYNVNPIGTGEGEARASYYEAFLKGVSESRKMEPGNLALQVLAVQTGGKAIDFNNDVSGVLRQSVADTQNYYEITFDPAPADPKNYYHRVEVKLANSELTARTRMGYYPEGVSPNK